MSAQATLARFVVIRNDGQHGVGAKIRGSPSALDRGGRRVSAAPGDDRHPAIGGPYRGCDDVAMFIDGERGDLTGRTAWHQPVAAFGDLPLDEFAECVLGDTSTGKWRHERRD